jgi:hypothetical protein
MAILEKKFKITDVTNERRRQNGSTKIKKETAGTAIDTNHTKLVEKIADAICIFSIDRNPTR